MPAAKKNTSSAQKKKRVIRKKVSKNTSEPTHETQTAESSIPTVTVESTPPAPVETATPTVTTTHEAETTSPVEKLESEFTSILTRLQQLKVLQQSVTSDVRRLQKNVHRYIKDANKRRRTRVTDPNKPKRAPSGFAKPALISSELCSFLGKPQGTEMARTEVTKYLTDYIRDRKLQDKENRRKIVPNKELKKLLNVKSGEELTYFNLQKYMKPHFPKPASASATA